MDRRDSRKAPLAAWLAAGAALLGTATLVLRRAHLARPRAAVGARYDQESGRGRPGTPPSPKARKAGHETRDLRGGTLAKLLLLLGGVAFCMVFAMVGLRLWVTAAQRGAEPQYTRVQRTLVTPPDPQLQRDPLRELANLRGREAARLGNYGFNGDDRTRAHIPIDRAMALTVGQPLTPPP